MKTVCVGVIVLLLCGALSATAGPIDKGSFYLNGSAFYQSQSGDLYEYDGDAVQSYGFGDAQLSIVGDFEVSPTFGYFVSPGVFLGAQVSVLGFKQGSDKLTAVAVGPTVGYYFNPNKERTEVKGSVYPYIRGFFNWGKLSDGLDADILQYGGKAGLLYMLSSAVAVDAGVQFRGDSWKPDGAPDSITGTTLSIGAGISAFIY